MPWWGWALIAFVGLWLLVFAGAAVWVIVKAARAAKLMDW